MIVWITENLASLVLLLVVGALVFFLVRSKIRQRKKGSCGCGCEGCIGCGAHKNGGQI